MITHTLARRFRNLHCVRDARQDIISDTTNTARMTHVQSCPAAYMFQLVSQPANGKLCDTNVVCALSKFHSFICCCFAACVLIAFHGNCFANLRFQSVCVGGAAKFYYQPLSSYFLTATAIELYSRSLHGCCNTRRGNNRPLLVCRQVKITIECATAISDEYFISHNTRQRYTVDDVARRKRQHVNCIINNEAGARRVFAVKIQL